MMKSSFTKRHLCLVLVVLLVLCNSLSTVAMAYPVIPKPTLSTTSGLFAYSGGERRITVSNAERVSASCPVSWVTLRTSGNYVYVTVAANKGKAARQTTVSISTNAGTLKYAVTQTNNFAIYITSPDSPTTNLYANGATANGDAVSCTLYTNAYGATRVVSNVSWAKPILSIQSKKITVTLSPNYTNKTRQATITVYDQLNQSKSMTISQGPWYVDIYNESLVTPATALPTTFSQETKDAYYKLISTPLAEITEKDCKKFATMVAVELKTYSPTIIYAESTVGYSVIEDCKTKTETEHTSLLFLKDGSVLFDKSRLKAYSDDAGRQLAKDIVYAVRRLWQKDYGKYNGNKYQYVLKYSVDNFKLYWKTGDYYKQIVERDACLSTDLFIIWLDAQLDK